MADVPAGALDLQHRGLGALRAGRLAHAVAAGIDHRRVHRAGADAVDADVVLAVIDRHRLGEADHGGLRGRVGGEPARPQRRDRRDVDDRAALGGLDHGRDGVLGEQEHRLDVDLHHPAIFLGLLVDDAAAAADADIVVEEVEPAPAVDRRIDQPLALGLLGDVAGMRRGRAALGLDHLHRALGELEVEIGHQHLGAGARQQDRRGAAVADAVARRAAARDDRDLAGQAGVVLRSLHRIPLQVPAPDLTASPTRWHRSPHGLDRGRRCSSSCPIRCGRSRLAA